MIENRLRNWVADEQFAKLGVLIDGAFESTEIECGGFGVESMLAERLILFLGQAGQLISEVVKGCSRRIPLPAIEVDIFGHGTIISTIVEGCNCLNLRYDASFDAHQ